MLSQETLVLPVGRFLSNGWAKFRRQPCGVGFRFDSDGTQKTYLSRRDGSIVHTQGLQRAPRGRCIEVRPIMHILLVEDQTLLRQHLARFVVDCLPGSLITEATTVAELRRVTEHDQKFALAVVDLDLPDGNALDWVREVSKQSWAPKIVILTSENREYVLYKAIHSNVSGFVHKNDDHSVLKTALRAVLDGGYYFSPTVNLIRQRMQSAPDFFLKILSAREQEILRLIAMGYSDDEIASQLSLKVASVGTHRKNLMTKLDLHSRDQIIAYGKEKGFDRLSFGT